MNGRARTMTEDYLRAGRERAHAILGGGMADMEFEIKKLSNEHQEALYMRDRLSKDAIDLQRVICDLKVTVHDLEETVSTLRMEAEREVGV
jgi:hypothetical protein